ncbi:MAG: GGDEF domain-containing protein, partial [Mariprofundaceae bacterium]
MRSLIQAGDKLSSATTALKDNMQTQVNQIQVLSKRLEDAESQARSDPLTGLASRRKLTEFLSALKDMSASFIMLDIDHFKSINDTYGHDSGDEILTLLTTLLTESIRETDMIARLGGEEFCVVLPEIDAEQTFHIAEKIRQAVEIYSFNTGQGKMDIRIGLGVAQHKKEEAHAAWLK